MIGARASMRTLAADIWHLLDASQKRECICVLSLSAVASCLTLGVVAGIAPFFAVLTDPAHLDRSSALVWLQRALEIEATQTLLVSLGIGFVALLIVANAANFVALRWIGGFAHGVGSDLHTLLFDEYLSRGVAFHARTNSAVLATRVVEDVGRTVGGIIHSGLALCSSAVSIALIAGAVIAVDPPLALVAIVALGTSYALIHALVRHRLIRNGTITTTHWKARAQVIDESFGAVKDVILHGAQPRLTARVAQHSDAIAAAQASTPAIAAAPRYVLEAVTGAGLVATALWMYGREDPNQWLTHLAFLGFAAYRLLPSVQQAFAAVAYIHAERPGFDAIAEDLRLARGRILTPPREPGAHAGWRGRPRRSIRLLDVSYRHPAAREEGVFGVSLEISAGTLAGFVGANGAGKSTLAELVLGLLKPDAGRIEVDGVALDDRNKNAWFKTVAYVPQQIALLDGTIAQNIAFEADAARIDFERVIEAARAARLTHFIQRLPDGVATVIGEHGAKLSGGQRQRIGIARALYRRPSLLVMDEGTNSLDALTEAEIMTLLGELRGYCTIILIGHRPSALSTCDVLFELDAGRVIARRVPAQQPNSIPPFGLALP